MMPVPPSAVPRAPPKINAAGGQQDDRRHEHELTETHQRDERRRRLPANRLDEGADRLDRRREAEVVAQPLPAGDQRDDRQQGA